MIDTVSKKVAADFFNGLFKNDLAQSTALMRIEACVTVRLNDPAEKRNQWCVCSGFYVRLES